MTSKEEREFWEIYFTLQKLCGLRDDDLDNKEVGKHLRLMANMVYFYRRDGAAKVKDAVREKELRELGVPILKPKGKP